MRPTRLGAGALVMLGLTTLTALSTGNNLLYLLYGAMAGALVVGAAGAALNLAAVEAVVEPPGQAFRGGQTKLRVKARSRRSWPAFAVEVAGPLGRARLVRVPVEGAEAQVGCVLPHRGLNRLSGLWVETTFPFGLFRARRRLPAVVLALPRLRELRAAADAEADARPSGRPALKKGPGEELYGLREYTVHDDARLINWKLSAKSALPLVSEFCSAHDSKVVVRLGPAPNQERAVEEAASACRFFIDQGCEVALELPSARLDFGRGLLHLDKLLAALALHGDGSSPREAALALAERARPVLEEPARRVTLALLVVVFGAMFLIDEIGAGLLLACAPVLAAGVFAQLARRRVLPDAAWTGLSAAMLLFTVLYDWRASGVAVANVHLLLYLLANRALSPFVEAEAGQVFLILFLAFFLVSGLTISLWYFAFFLAYAGLAAVWLSLACGLPAGQWRSWRRGAAWAAGAALAIAAALFAATPRVEGFRRMNPFIAVGIDKLAVKSSSVMGFTENVSLGFFGELKKSPARVMRVSPVPAPSGRPAPLYVRGSAFDSFDGRHWAKAPSAAARSIARRRGEELFFPVGGRSGADTVYEFSIYPMSLSVLFTVGTPRLVEGVEGTAFLDRTDSVKLAAPYLSGIRYREHSAGLSGFGEEFDRARYLQVPPDSRGRRAGLAARITAKALTDEDKVRAVESYLRRAYAYSTYSDGRDRDVDDFLFSARKGNCEYFASAAVALLRASGVPARLVSGFLADDWNEYGRFFDVRQSNAHAWAEAYVEGRGWLMVEATPPQSGFGASADALTRRLERWFEAAQTQWYRHIIGYDVSVQNNTFKRLGTLLSPDALADALARAARPAAGAGAAVALWFALLWAARVLRAKPRDPFERAAELLARKGFAREAHWTPLEFAAAVTARRPELAALRALVELHYLERYAGRTSSPESLRLLNDLRRRL